MEASGAALLTDADDAPPGAPGRYQRHRPEQTLLYQVIAQHYPPSWPASPRRGAPCRAACMASETRAI
jgi:hypothetical protein